MSISPETVSKLCYIGVVFVFAIVLTILLTRKSHHSRASMLKGTIVVSASEYVEMGDRSVGLIFTFPGTYIIQCVTSESSAVETYSFIIERAHQEKNISLAGQPSRVNLKVETEKGDRDSCQVRF